MNLIQIARAAGAVLIRERSFGLSMTFQDAASADAFLEELTRRGIARNAGRVWAQVTVLYCAPRGIEAAR